MKLPRLQLHLSTLLLVSLLAAGLVWLNVHGSMAPVKEIGGGESRFFERGIGWPLPFFIYISSTDFRWIFFIVDCLVFFGLLFSVTVAVEWLTRRMKRGAP